MKRGLVQNNEFFEDSHESYSLDSESSNYGHKRHGRRGIQYQVSTDEQRQKLISLVEEKKFSIRKVGSTFLIFINSQPKHVELSTVLLKQ